MSIIIKSVNIIDDAKQYEGLVDIFIDKGIIKHIGVNMECDAETVIDANGLSAIPGLVDLHTHLREPGFEYKETIKTGTQAAAKGGYTSVCCMPNTKPPIDNIEILNLLKDIIEKDSSINVYPIAAISIGQDGSKLTDLHALKKAGAVAFSDDGRPVYNSLIMRQALELANKYNYLIIDHCEDLNLTKEGAINEGAKARELGLVGIPGIAEEIMVMRDIMLAEEMNAPIHIAHVSTEKSVEMIRIAKKRGVRVTCEVTPHHISLSEDIIESNYTDCKVSPPLRTKKDIKALKEALVDGTIDIIATDHAPHASFEKTDDFYKSVNGISNIEAAFSICYHELVASGIMPFNELLMKMSYRPSQLLGIKAGKLEVGFPADIAIVDENSKVIVDKQKMLSKGTNTPFHGRSYSGEVVLTVCKGKIVYEGRKDDVCR